MFFPRVGKTDTVTNTSTDEIMKNLILLIMIGLVAAGCSKSEEETKSESLGKDLANRIKNPIERAKAVSEKTEQSRGK